MIWFCDGGTPGGIPEIFIYFDSNNRVRMAPDAYVLQTFIESTTTRAMCRLGVWKNGSSKTVNLGYKFLSKSKTFFDNKAGKIAFSGFHNYDFWNDFDWELAITGIICIVVLLIIIVYFAWIRNKNLEKLEADKREEEERLDSDISSF